VPPQRPHSGATRSAYRDRQAEKTGTKHDDDREDRTSADYEQSRDHGKGRADSEKEDVAN
jgi:hypothetical protein